MRKRWESHGDAGSRDRSIPAASEYRSWIKMIRRCTDPKQAGFKNYGGRGITVCKEWLSYTKFLADMGRKPSPKYTIDRINNDGNYEPGNCRWADPVEQRRKTRRSKVTAEIAADIRRRLAAGETRAAVAADLGLHAAHVSRIGSGQRWA